MGLEFLVARKQGFKSVYSISIYRGTKARIGEFKMGLEFFSGTKAGIVSFGCKVRWHQSGDTKRMLESLINVQK